LELAWGNPEPLPGALQNANYLEAGHSPETSDCRMLTQTNNGLLNVSLLKWVVVPLLGFLLAGWVTRKIVTAKQDGESERFQRTVDASIRKLDSGDRAGAVEGLVRAGKMAPGDVARQASLIPKFTALGEQKLAMEAMEHSIRSVPKENQAARSYAGLVEYLLSRGAFEDAKRILTGDLMVRWPDAFETSYLQGAVALKNATEKDEIAAAAAQLQKCVALDPGHAQSKLQLGVACRRLGEWDKAESLLRAALENRPFDSEVLYHLGEVLRQQGKTPESTKYLDEHKRISELHQRQEHLEAQYSLRKHQPADLLELSRIYGQLGEPARAASTLRVYTLLQPTEPEGHR
jgi:tetratricopeptide (TPR) repeat protein